MKLCNLGKKLLFLALTVNLVSCATLLPPNHPTSKYDEFKKEWTIRSSRWGNDFKNFGPNPSFIRAFVTKKGIVSSQVYAIVRTETNMYPKYALTSNGKKYNVQTIDSEVKCISANSCYWYQDIIIDIDYLQIAEELNDQSHFIMRVYGRTQPQDVSVLACQFWEITEEINRIKGIDPKSVGVKMGPSCSVD